MSIPNLLPIRLQPGDDVRAALMQTVSEQNAGPAFVLSGIGSLHGARLRFAGESEETIVHGALEIISISGSLTPGGAHLHMAVSDSAGRLIGGHVGFGNIVRTTLEAVLVFLPAWNLTREFDSATGYDELHIERYPSR